MPGPTTLVTHPDCNRHDTGPGHPESQARLPAMLAAVRADADLAAVLVERRGEPATVEDLLRVHTAQHVAVVREAALTAARLGGNAWLDPDTAVSPASWDAALASAGCAISATELVLAGDSPTAFALCRPPGHHAMRDRAMGFCLFDNVAVAIRRAQVRGRARQVLVVDWDVHHGNGTQDIFYEDPSVYVLSLHLSPHYPGTGSADERGAGAGLVPRLVPPLRGPSAMVGTTRNVPLPFGTTSNEYRPRFRDALDEALDTFEPDLVLVSAGFDCLAGDPLGGLELEPADLHALTNELLERVREPAGGRVVAVLEGGYVPARIGAGLVNVLRAFAGLPAR